ncbi:MAG: hydroxyethylthiazole kinase [Methylobacterium sp.]|nr:hydroxyethylthiazole kinase [Methylobacterium sp.]
MFRDKISSTASCLPVPMTPFPLDEARRLARALARALAMRRPRIHVLTNPVAQALSAQALVALGAEPSMSAHPRDILALARGADAILVNLGMLEPAREAAIEALLAEGAALATPVVLDPVMADRVPFRRQLAERFSPFPRLLVKGNAAEMAALRGAFPAGTVLVTTGGTDHVEGSAACEITGGHPLMARFSGSGCLAGAVIAAFASVEPEPARAAAAALTALRHAAAEAGAAAQGPGTFVPLLLDSLARFSEG